MDNFFTISTRVMDVFFVFLILAIVQITFYKTDDSPKDHEENKESKK